jgi:hypothetical protein
MEVDDGAPNQITLKQPVNKSRIDLQHGTSIFIFSDLTRGESETDEDDFMFF